MLPLERKVEIKRTLPTQQIVDVKQMLQTKLLLDFSTQKTILYLKIAL